MKKITQIALCLILCFLMLPLGSVSSLADGSHGFYMDCDASVVSNKSDGFMIDFYSDSPEALCTYFSNANWSMYTGATAQRYNYRSITGGGAYAGLQILDNTNQRRGIMSFWRYEYVDGSTGEKKYLYAEAVYGKTTTYDNEGSGTSCVMPYNWKSGQWYRQLLYCWRDIQTGNTYMGTWFYDYEEDTWSLFAYYDTKLFNSYIVGGVGQFLENFVESQGARYRSFRYRNIYFLSHDNGNWVSSPTVNLRSDGNSKAFGEAKLGVSEDNTYVWASVDGTSEVDTDHEIKIKPTLTQADTPSVGTPAIESVTVKTRNGKGLTVSWDHAEHSTPQLQYILKLYDPSGKLLATRKGTRPEVVSQEFETMSSDAVRVELSVTDVFGQSTDFAYETESYRKEVEGDDAADGSGAVGGDEGTNDNESDLPEVPNEGEGGESTENENIKPGAPTEEENDQTQSENESPNTKDDGESSNTWIYVVGGIAVAVVAVGALLGIWIFRKKKEAQ